MAQCKNRGCKWPCARNDTICEHCAMHGTPAQQRKDERERLQREAKNDKS